MLGKLTLLKSRLRGVTGLFSDSLAVILFLFLFIIVLALCRIFPGKIIIIALCCIITSKLIYLCRSRIIGGLYLMLTVVFCHVPALMIQKSVTADSAIANIPDILKQSSFFFGIIFLSFVSACILSLLQAKLKGKLTVLVMKALSVLLFLAPLGIPVCYIANWVLNNPALDSDAILAVYQTNVSEAADYFSTFVNKGRLIAVLFLMLIMAVLAIKTVDISFSTEKLRGAAMLLSVTFIIGAYSVCKHMENIVTEPFYKANEAINEFEIYEQFTNLRVEMIKKLPKISNDRFKGTYVVVLGESLNRDFMEVYGYKKHNTPWQTSIRQQNKGIFFNRGFSNHTHTVQALTYALTQKNQYRQTDNEWNRSLSIIDIARYGANFNTVWVSNQKKLGLYSTPISTIANNANEQYWLNHDNNYDYVVVKQLKNLKLTSDNNMIFIHLMGSHGRYVDRYPSKYQQFSGENINESFYNNTVLYNDSIMQRIYEIAKDFPGFQGLIYISDHGEEVANSIGHNSAKFDWEMTKIPFWMIFSDSYKLNHPDIINNLKHHENVPFTNDLLFDTLLGITGLKNKEFYDEVNDFSSESYGHSYDDLMTLHGKKNIREVVSTRESD